VVLILPIAAPGATSRMLAGFGETDVAGENIINKYNATTGRNLIWPVVISKIGESPVFGFGREATRRTGVRERLRAIDRDVDAGHPHNAYLEVLLDSGLIGFVIIVGLYMIIWVHSVRLFVDRGDPIYTAVGGLALALLTGHLVAHIGGQSFYPEVTDVGLWCAIGIMFRLHVERDRLAAMLNGTLASWTRNDKDVIHSQTPLGWANS